MKRLALLVTGALLLSFTTLVPMTSALADSKAITFEPPDYSTSTGVPPGSIDHQDGWAGQTPPGVPINPLYDQAVVPTSVTGFGTQAFRMSNAVTSGSFADWPFSPSLANEAGETSAVSNGFSGGTRQPGFQASFDVASTVPGAEQLGLQVSISPDRGDGARMSFLRLRDTPAGIAVDFADYESGQNETGCGTGANFVTTTVATMNRSTTHNIKLTMDFLNGTANDIVKVYVDGTLVHTGTSWEDYYLECEGNPTRTVDSLIFQARTQTQNGDTPTTWAANAGNGFLFDNLNYSSGPRASCTETGFFRDGINMTAAQIGGNVTSAKPLDATGCNIGVYYDSTHTGNVTGAEIFGANYFGVVVRGTSVNVTGSDIHDIGQVPLDGTQHGNAIYFATVGTGSATAPPTCTTGATTGIISGNTVEGYQKGGIINNCAGTSVTVTNNTVTGQGPVPYIAQNGIVVGYGAKATVRNNTVTGNQYTGAGLTSSGGILVVGGPCYNLPLTTGLTITKNTLTNNDVGVWLFNANASCAAVTDKTNNTVKFNTASNSAVTNTTGYSATCGYQAGVADVGHKDLIVNNSISGAGYTPVPGDCGGIPPAFVRRVDTDSSARGVPSNK